MELEIDWIEWTRHQLDIHVPKITNQFRFDYHMKIANSDRRLKKPNDGV